MSRDLRGYAGKTPDIIWPNGSRLAVSVVVNFEEGAELQVGDGDASSEVVGEVHSIVGGSHRDLGQEQIFAYGMRAGLWRFFDAFEQCSLPATFFCCGRAVERVPELAAEITARGHEAACHGWRWRPHSDYASANEESQDLDRCISVMEHATGQRPVGFFCRGSESIWTRDLLLEKGFLYTSNAFDDDVPYFADTAHGQLVVVPYALDCNDMKFFHPNGFVCASDFVTYVEDALTVLRSEAARGQTRLLNIGLHLRICGRPSRFLAVRNILQTLNDLQDEIWVATRTEIAHHFTAEMSQRS